MKIISRFLFLMVAFSLSDSSVAYGQEERESFEVAGGDVQRIFPEFHKSLARELKVNEKHMANSTSGNTRIDQDMTTTMRSVSCEIKRFIEACSAKDGDDLVFDPSGQFTNQTPTILGREGIVDLTQKIFKSLNRDASKGRKKIEP